MYFAGFLQDATNKEELFNLLTEDAVKHDYPPSKHMYITSGSHVKSNSADVLVSANHHKETDNRICLHVDDALNDGVTAVLARPVGIDVVVQHHPGMQLWVSFGTGKHFRYVHIKSICQ